MNNNDHHKPPFCWCHDEEIPDDVLYEIETDEERAERLSWRHRCIIIPVEEDKPDAAHGEPQDGETYVTTWGELLYLMTQGEMGTKPSETPRRYEPPRQPPPQR